MQTDVVPRHTSDKQTCVSPQSSSVAQVAPPVPASGTTSQTHCSRHSSEAVQLTMQTQPESSAAHDDPDGQPPVPPQDRVHRLPGNRTPDSQRPLSHSVPSWQGPPTNALSFPTGPDGRPSSPQPTNETSAADRTKKAKGNLIAAQTIDRAEASNQGPRRYLCNIRVTFDVSGNHERRATRRAPGRRRPDPEPIACALLVAAPTASPRPAHLAPEGPSRT